MRSTVTVSIPQDVRKELDRVSVAEGMSRSDIVRESVRDYLFIRQLRSLRKVMVPKAARRGVHTDQDVFDRVS
jgi:metal-responsive CopG/Arc/MetJ family transcriptional regulator